MDILERQSSELVVGEILGYVGFGRGELGLLLAHSLMEVGGAYFSRRPFGEPSL